MMTILIADDHAIMREGLKSILLKEYPDAFIEEASDTETLITKAVEGSWTAILTDLVMPGKSVIDAIKQIKLQHAKLPVLVLSMHPEDRYAIRVLRAGASGYIVKESAPAELITAMRLILEGRKYISPSVAERLANELDLKNPASPHENLSNRELDVYRLIGQGNSISSIADQLGLNSTTVSTYRSRILLKMNMKTNAELIRYALENKLW